MGLLASYFQGPDRRTAIRSKTRSVALFAFSAPGMSRETPEAALDWAIHTFEGAFERLHGPLFLECDNGSYL
jgi:DNA/RNA-binding domain of Phe-tRNA-synthetase-like protein